MSAQAVLSPLGRRKLAPTVHKLDGMETIERPVPERSRAWIVVACLAPLPFVAALILDSGSTVLLVTAIVSGLILVTAALVWAVGRSRRQRREFEERLASWAAERAIEQERLRIARDLHDLSSHGLGLITVRAAATGYLDGAEADAERQRAMHDIERIGRSTTTELRRMLTLLRSPGDNPAPLNPADTLAALPDIITEAERGGLIIQATIVQAPLGDRSVYATDTQAELFTSLALAVASWTGLGMISTSIAFLIQSQTVALSVMIVLSFGGTPLMMALPVFQYLPTNAGVLMFIDRASQTSDWLNPPDITVPVAGITLALWCLAVIIAAAIVLLRRDIGARQAGVE